MDRIAEPDGLRALVAEHLQAGDTSSGAIYDRMRAELVLGPAWESRPRVALEIGGGPGTATRVLSQIPGVRLCIALDISRSYLTTAESQVYPLARVQASADGVLPLKGGRVDYVLASEVFEHLWNRPQFIAEVWRILRPGGVFVLTTPNLDAFALQVLRRLPRPWTRRILTRESPAHQGLHPEFFPEVLADRSRVWHVIEGVSLTDLRRMGEGVGFTTLAAGTWGLPLTVGFWDRVPRGLRARVMSLFRFLPFGLRHVVIVFRKDLGAERAPA